MGLTKNPPTEIFFYVNPSLKMSIDLSYVFKFPVLFISYLFIFLLLYKFLYWAFNIGKRNKFGINQQQSKKREISFKFKEDITSKKKKRDNIPEKNKLFMYSDFYDKSLLNDAVFLDTVDELKYLISNINKSPRKSEDNQQYFKGLRNSVLEESKKFVYAQINPKNGKSGKNIIETEVVETEIKPVILKSSIRIKGKKLSDENNEK